MLLSLAHVLSFIPGLHALQELKKHWSKECLPLVAWRTVTSRNLGLLSPDTLLSIFLIQCCLTFLPRVTKKIVCSVTELCSATDSQ